MPRFSFLFLCILLCYSPSLYAQISLKGAVWDKANERPIKGANVFIANTTKGTVSDERGRFVLHHLEEGSVEIVVSFLGYENYVVSQEIRDGRTYEIRAELAPEVIDLTTIEVKAMKVKKRRRYVRQFTEAFFGRTSNADHCQLLNPEVLDFQVERRDIFQASSDALLEIDNRALGYKLFFLLEHFSLDGDEISFSGKPFFQPLPASHNNNDTKKWEKNRAITYAGSKRHFFHSLYRNQLQPEGFDIYLARLEPDHTLTPVRAVQPAEIMQTSSKNDQKVLNLNTFLQIVYRRETDEITASLNRTSITGVSGLGQEAERELIAQERRNFKQRKHSDQVSYLFSRTPQVAFCQNGVVLQPEHIKVYGYWSYEGIADLLPVEYDPNAGKSAGEGN